MESASGEPRWPAFTRTPYSYPGSLFTVLEARSRRPFGAWPRRVAVRRRRTLIFGRRTSTERLAADPRPHRVRRRLAPELAAGIARGKSAKSIGVRSGKWLTLRQAQALLNAPDIATTKGPRDRAIIAPCRPAAPCASARWPRAPTGAVRADSRRRRRPLRRDAMFRIHYPPEERSSRLWPRHLPRFQARGTSLKTNPSRLARVAELPAIER